MVVVFVTRLSKNSIGKFAKKKAWKTIKVTTHVQYIWYQKRTTTDVLGKNENFLILGTFIMRSLSIKKNQLFQISKEKTIEMTTCCYAKPVNILNLRAN